MKVTDYQLYYKDCLYDTCGYVAFYIVVLYFKQLPKAAINRTMAPPERGNTHPIAVYYSSVDLERMKG